MSNAAITRTGAQIVARALREIRIIQPTQAPNDEQMSGALQVAESFIDGLRTQRLTVGGVTTAYYPLTGNKGAYTIGPGGDFDQDYPSDIVKWGVFPDTTQTNKVEIPMGRPMNPEQFSRITVQGLAGAYPRAMKWDQGFDASGRGTLTFYPVPDGTFSVAVNLYCLQPDLTTLAQDTTYTLRPGCARMLELNLALELADQYGKAAQVSESLVARAADALANYKRAHLRPRPSPIPAEWVIGQGVTRRTFNIYTDEG